MDEDRVSLDRIHELIRERRSPAWDSLDKHMMLCCTCDCNPDVATLVPSDCPYLWWSRFKVIKSIFFECVFFGPKPAFCLCQSIMDLPNNLAVSQTSKGWVVSIFLGQSEVESCDLMGLQIGG